jgi:drug/metabolite transporter (DMT)-like permease
MTTPTTSGGASGNQTDWTAFALLVMTGLCWSGNTVFVRALHESIAPAGVSFWRTVLTVLVLLPFVFGKLRAQFGVLRSHWRLIFMIGFAQFAVGQAMLYLGLQTTTAVNAGLILGVQPALTVILAWLMVGERLRPIQSVGVVLALVGVSAIILRGDLGSLHGFEFVIGDIWVGVAVIGWSIYAPFVRRLPREIDPFVLVTATTFCGGIGLVPFYAGEVYWLGIHTEATWETFAIICYIALFGTILGVVGWNIGIARIGPSRASTFLYLIPVFTVVLGVTALGETLHMYQVVGMVLVLAGVTITNRAGVSRASTS